MNTIHEENDWLSQFDINQKDLDQIARRLKQQGTPQELKDIALRLVRERLGQDHDPGPTADINQQTEDILLNDGERILSRLGDALGLDSRFTSLEGQWFLTDHLPQIEKEALHNVHHMLLRNPSSSEQEILSALKENGSTDKTVLRMALHAALHRSPEHFENTGTPAHPQWKARLPDAEQAEVTHYAYDPQTYEILCRPAQRLSQRKAERLQELHLYVHVVTFAE